jgi:hypothetical protein
MATAGASAWVDPEAYRTLHAAKRAAFDDQIARDSRK